MPRSPSPSPSPSSTRRREIPAEAAPKLARYPSSARVFLPRGRPPLEGTILRQPELARTLGLIERRGPDGFYRGPVAAAIAADVRAGGGILSLEDLAAYRMRVRSPIEGTYGEYRLLVPPPPSGGAL